ncbi:type II toxin-antitoxin system VapC family toxin [Arthrobacter sp. H5]|uniref:type II toxin-antitoxin system VapC family toxin n=1 Tax=Arthrobacter sp. H5 TaxID=1267973 RepID=UPI00048572C4|nr:type II toxin-antitoxin system VapC family toxin [Arthrobacter sp. H5]
MIIDTSAIVAVLLDEPESGPFREWIAANTVKLSAGTYIETGIVIDRLRLPGATRLFDRFLHDAGITLEPVTKDQAMIARAAYRDYGKGSGHKAQLNFGDCFSYALATDLREPLLFKGNDFIHTDVVPATRV